MRPSPPPSEVDSDPEYSDEEGVFRRAMMNNSLFLFFLDGEVNVDLCERVFDEDGRTTPHRNISRQRHYCQIWKYLDHRKLAAGLDAKLLGQSLWAQREPGAWGGRIACRDWQNFQLRGMLRMICKVKQQRHAKTSTSGCFAFAPIIRAVAAILWKRWFCYVLLCSKMVSGWLLVVFMVWRTCFWAPGVQEHQLISFATGISWLCEGPYVSVWRFVVLFEWWSLKSWSLGILFGQ